MIEKITAEEIYANSVERLADHPNAASRYGTGGLSAANSKEAFTKLAKLAIAKNNEIIDAINADASDESIIKMINTQVSDGLDGYKTLYDVITDVLGGDFAGYLALTGLTESDLQAELEDIEAGIDALETSVGTSADEAAASGSVYARIAQNKADIVTNAAGLTTLDGNKVNKSDIVNDLTTGGIAKVLSAEQGKALQTNKVNVSDIVDNLVSGGAAVPLSAEQGKDINSRLTAAEGDIDTLEASLGETADTASASGTAYARIKYNYDTATTNKNAIGTEASSATILYRTKQLETGLAGTISELAGVKAIAEARQQPVTADDIAYFSEWLKGTEGYTVELHGEEITPPDLLTGTVILLRAETEPDFWWDGGISTAGTVEVNGKEYVSTAEAGGVVIGGIRELEYNFSEVSAAVSEAEGYKDGAETAQTAAETARDEARKWADGTGATSEDDQYENNAKHYAEEAGASEAAAEDARDDARKWADGTGALSGEAQYENNAKHYAEAAEDARDRAELAAANMVITDTDTSEQYSYSFKLVGGKPQIEYSLIT
jgi:hypothetical protein